VSRRKTNSIFVHNVDKFKRIVVISGRQCFESNAKLTVQLCLAYLMLLLYLAKWNVCYVTAPQDENGRRQIGHSNSSDLKPIDYSVWWTLRKKVYKNASAMEWPNTPSKRGMDQGGSDRPSLRQQPFVIGLVISRRASRPALDILNAVIASNTVMITSSLLLLTIQSVTRLWAYLFFASSVLIMWCSNSYGERFTSQGKVATLIRWGGYLIILPNTV